MFSSRRTGSQRNRRFGRTLGFESLPCRRLMAGDLHPISSDESPEPATAIAEERRDFDGSGTVNAYDLMLVLRCLRDVQNGTMAPDEAVARMDLNNNGVMDPGDVLPVVQHLRSDVQAAQAGTSLQMFSASGDANEAPAITDVQPEAEASYPFDPMIADIAQARAADRYEDEED